MTDRRIDEVEPVEGGFFMVHLKPGFRINDEGCHTFGADTRAEIKQTMKIVASCSCGECQAHQHC